MFFVTTTVVHFAKVFTEDHFCNILLKNIKHYQGKYHFTIYAFVIMPSHFHWIVETNPNFGTISDIMRDIKKYSAWDIMDALERNGKVNFLKLFSFEATGHPQQRRKFWMRRFDDQVIRNSEMLKTKIEYIHNNPVKAGLAVNPEDYKYSSARNYLYSDHSVLEVLTDWL